MRHNQREERDSAQSLTRVVIFLTINFSFWMLMFRHFHALEGECQPKENVFPYMMTGVKNYDPYVFASSFDQLLASIIQIITFIPFVFLMAGSAFTSYFARGHDDISVPSLRMSIQSNTYAAIGLGSRDLVRGLLLESESWRQFGTRPDKVVACYNLRGSSAWGFPSVHTLNFSPFVFTALRELIRNWDTLTKPQAYFYSGLLSFSSFSIYSRYLYSWHSIDQLVMTFLLTTMLEVSGTFELAFNLFGQRVNPKILNIVSKLALLFLLAQYLPSWDLTNLFFDFSRITTLLVWGTTSDVVGLACESHAANRFLGQVLRQQPAELQGPTQGRAL